MACGCLQLYTRVLVLNFSTTAVVGRGVGIAMGIAYPCCWIWFTCSQTMIGVKCICSR
jgi:hypothetical protein